MQNKMWAVLIHLTNNMWGTDKNPWIFDEKTWNNILKMSAEKGFNTIVLDVGDGICYKSHPEISLEGAWTHERVHKEIKKASGLGIKLIPKLNFSATHDAWLGEYERMVSTKTYYTVCRDIINEIYEVFEQPDYIHLGMDEEDSRTDGRLDFVCYRKNELIWHDLKYLCDCVSETGAKPWIWADLLIHYPDKFREHFKPDSVLLSPWQYFAMYEEHFTPIKDDPVNYKYYTTGIFTGCGFEYVEEDPLCANYREQIVPAMKDGFSVVPTTSNVNKCPYNNPDTLRWFKEKAPDDKVVGFMNASWKMTTPEFEKTITECIDLMADARAIYYPEEI